MARVVGNVLDYLKYLYLIPWLTIDRTREGTVFTIDQELRAICESVHRGPRSMGSPSETSSDICGAEIVRRRKENNDEMGRRRWSTEAILSLEQTALLNWIEIELDRIP